MSLFNCLADTWPYLKCSWRHLVTPTHQSNPMCHDKQGLQDKQHYYWHYGHRTIIGSVKHDSILIYYPISHRINNHYGLLLPKDISYAGSFWTGWNIKHHLAWIKYAHRHDVEDQTSRAFWHGPDDSMDTLNRRKCPAGSSFPFLILYT